MNKLNKHEIGEVLRLHQLWLNSGPDGTCADLTGTNLVGADLTGVNLRCADFSGAKLRYADFSGANLRFAKLTGADLRYAKLTGAKLTGADFIGANLRFAKLTDVNLADADLSRADLSYANLSYAKLADADLSYANLTGADLTGAYLNCAIGNMREIKTLQVEQYPVAWIQSPEGDTIVQIGCQRHRLALWKVRDDIARSVGQEKEWQRLSPILFQLIEASPAVPYGT